jgi:hypothetical protein
MRRIIEQLEDQNGNGALTHPLESGFFLYDPGRRQVPAALGALIDMLQMVRSPAKGWPHAREPVRRRVRSSSLDDWLFAYLGAVASCRGGAISGLALAHC